MSWKRSPYLNSTPQIIGLRILTQLLSRLAMVSLRLPRSLVMLLQSGMQRIHGRISPTELPNIFTLAVLADLEPKEVQTSSPRPGPAPVQSHRMTKVPRSTIRPRRHQRPRRGRRGAPPSDRKRGAEAHPRWIPGGSETNGVVRQTNCGLHVICGHLHDPCDSPCDSDGEIGQLHQWR